MWQMRLTDSMFCIEGDFKKWRESKSRGRVCEQRCQIGPDCPPNLANLGPRDAASIARLCGKFDPIWQHCVWDGEREEIAGSRHGSKQLFIIFLCAVISTQINNIDVDDSVSFNIYIFQISINRPALIYGYIRIGQCTYLNFVNRLSEALA